jgi:hypothetical protein
MSESRLKVANTKLAKQLSAFALIINDMEFCARTFTLAAKLPSRSSSQVTRDRPSATARLELIFAFDPILRAGAAVGQFEEDLRDDNEVLKSALFEAAIVTYGRCFNSGLRTRLSDRMFTGPFAYLKRDHETLVRIRNQHVAHSELKAEHSLVGFQLVEDRNYGERPNLVTTVVSARRNYPRDERLLEFGTHCEVIASQIVQKKILEIGRALREQLLKMPAEQIAALPDFGSHPSGLEDIFS